MKKYFSVLGKIDTSPRNTIGMQDQKPKTAFVQGKDALGLAFAFVCNHAGSSAQVTTHWRGKESKKSAVRRMLGDRKR